MALLELAASKVEHGGIEAWFEATAEDFGVDDKKYRKLTDTLDVWFDSGATFETVLGGPEGRKTRMGSHSAQTGFPADLYLEGSDQHRGWFRSSLLESCMVNGTPPYKALLTHGFVVDGEGKKMSKSKGNVVAPQKVSETLGAEILRLWVAATDYSGELNISDEILKRVVESYRRIRNTLRFLLANTSDFDATRNAVPLAEMFEIDRFALAQAQGLALAVEADYGRYEIHLVVQRLQTFCSEELGGFYLDVLKDRLYTAAPDSRARRSAQTALALIRDALLKLMAPILSFTAEEAWRILHPSDPTVFVHVWKDALPTFAHEPELIAKWERILAVRAAVLKELETVRQSGAIGSSLQAEVLITAPDEDYAALAEHGIPPAADGDVERRSRTARVGEAGRKADLVDKVLRVLDGLYSPRLFTAPPLVPVLFDVVWKFYSCLLVVSTLPEQIQVDRLAHRFVTCVARVQVIAGIVGGQHLFRIAGIARGFIEVDHAVIGVAGPDPFVQRLTLRFAGVGVISRAPEGGERRTENLHASRVRPHDQLLVSGNEVLGAGSRSLTGVPDVVDPFHHDDVCDARLTQHVGFEPGQRVDARAVRALAEHAVAADAGVQDSDVPGRGRCEQASREHVGPPAVRVGRRCRAVGNGVAERHDDASSVRGVHLDTRQEKPAERGVDDGQPGRARVIAGFGDVGRLKRRVVHRKRRRRIGRAWKIQVDGQIGQWGHRQVHGIAVNDRVRRNGDGAAAAEPHRTPLRRHDGVRLVAQGDVGRANRDGSSAEQVADHDAQSRSANARPHDLTERLIRKMHERLRSERSSGRRRGRRPHGSGRRGTCVSHERRRSGRPRHGRHLRAADERGRPGADPTFLRLCANRRPDRSHR
jgi:hypothetical protein